MANDRLPKKIALYLLEEKAQCFKKWQSLSVEHSLPIPFANMSCWEDWQQSIIMKIENATWYQLLSKAQQSNVRRSYPQLNHNLGNLNYFKNSFSIEQISFIFRARGELLNLNYKPHIVTPSDRCPICNLNSEENILHFLGECPILREYRLLYLGKGILNQYEISEYLNGKNWFNLFNYIKSALNYRMQILEERF